MTRTLILGGGFTGLATGLVNGAPVYEACDVPGGLGASYEMDGYRFEKAGGHWCFGGTPEVIGFLKGMATCKQYERKASVFFPDSGKFYPYPLQAHPEFKETMELETGGEYGLDVVTMKDALRKQFGITACEKFFFPFNDLYTAGLYDKVAPQDAYKSPVQGKGYNVSFLYPTEGLGTLARRMAAKCQMHLGKRVQWIDVHEKMVRFNDDTCQGYDKLISTLPLNRVMEMTGLHMAADKPDPHVGVWVSNIGAVRGPNCPDDHWVYVPHSNTGFHRIGFYSNIDSMFAPSNDRVAIYVEKAFAGDCGIPEWKSTVDELQSWGWIKDYDVIDPTRVDVAYTYRWPGSTWREDSLALLAKHDIVSTGRYGKWSFQGIMESIKDGFDAGVKYG